jgi:hypothetical protein
VKSAHITYDGSSKGKPVPGSKVELGVTGQSLAMRMTLPLEIGGEKGTLNVLFVENRDSMYKWTDGDGSVNRSLRSFLAKEYDALDGAAKARLRENLKLTDAVEDDAFGMPSFLGEKTGSQTIAGHRCDVYRAGKTTTCVLSQAVMIPLSMTDEQGLTWVATKVTLNGALPPATSVLPKGVRWKKERDFEGGDFAVEIWTQKKETDPTSATPAAIAQFAIRYLASPQAASELRERRGPAGEETGEAEDPADEAEQSEE